MKPPSTKLLAAAGVVSFAVIAGIAAASNSLLPGVHNGVITACIEPVTQGNPATSGDLNMFHCAKGAKRLSWSIKGPAGTGGCEGVEGPKGSEGPAGPQGSHGPCGREGRDGCQGQPVRVPTGATGPAGAKGDTGATGATGPAGAPGSTGATGPAGPGSTIMTATGSAPFTETSTTYIKDPAGAGGTNGIQFSVNTATTVTITVSSNFTSSVDWWRLPDGLLHQRSDPHQPVGQSSLGAQRPHLGQDRGRKRHLRSHAQPRNQHHLRELQSDARHDLLILRNSTHRDDVRLIVTA